VEVWLFGGCGIDEIRRLEVDCIVPDEDTEEDTGKRCRSARRIRRHLVGSAYLNN